VGGEAGPAGDLYVITRVSESPVFKRNGENLEVEVPLTIPEALQGAVIEVPTLNGSKRLRVPPGTKPGTVQRLRGEGPARLAGKGNGDIHYRFVLDVPSSLSPEQSEAVDRLSKVMNGNPRERLFAAANGEGA
jgi:molecular chaperone DnaJ